MRNKLTSAFALAAALAPGVGNAIGFGEIALQSRIGEALKAEVPILTDSGESPLTACFSLVPVRSADLPSISAARTRLVRRGKGYVLEVLGYRPTSEPIFAIAIQAGCGYDVVRSYILMPEAPFSQAEAYAPPPPVAAATGKAAKSKEWRASEGETLEDIADARAPNDPAERQRLLAGLQSANPDLSPETPLAEGTAVRLPAGRQAPAGRRKTASRPAAKHPAESSPSLHASPQPAKAKPSPPRPAADQLVLGAAPEESAARDKTPSRQESLAATEERLLKLETTLRVLTQEVEKVDQALDLVSKTLEAQGKLQQTQAHAAGALAPPPLPEAEAVGASPRSSGLELFMSAALGAVVAIGLAQLLGRRRRHPGEEESPLAFARPRKDPAPPVAPKAERLPMIAVAEAASEAPPAGLSSAISEPPPRSASESRVVDIVTEDAYSILDLAEIMLSYGRVSGAVQTLAEYVDQNLPGNVQPWTRLLDLYRRGGMRQEFEDLATKTRSRFNVLIPAWTDSDTPVSGLKTLEDYPHLIQKTTACWGTQACLDYLLDLVRDTRNGQRNGFPLEVIEEIALLMRILEETYGLKRSV